MMGNINRLYPHLDRISREYLLYMCKVLYSHTYKVISVNKHGVIKLRKSWWPFSEHHKTSWNDNSKPIGFIHVLELYTHRTVQITNVKDLFEQFMRIKFTDKSHIRCDQSKSTSLDEILKRNSYKIFFVSKRLSNMTSILKHHI